MKVRVIPYANGEHHSFYCPGCDRHHSFQISPVPGQTSWTFDGNTESPTYSPSFLTWVDKETKQKADPELAHLLPPDRCHLFVNRGQIQYLSDCTHKLAGQTVPLVELDEIGRVLSKEA